MASQDSASQPLPIAVLLSGGGTTMLNLAQQIEVGTLNAQIKLVIASNDTSAAKGIERAEGLGLPSPVIRRKDHADTAAFSQAIFDRVREAGCELVCMAGFLSLLSIPEDFEARVMNIHPSLLPAFGGKGMHGRHVHEAVIKAGAKVSGCTVHFADNTYDTGPILVQKTCPVLPCDDPETLGTRVFEQECLAYPEAVAAFGEGRVKFRDGIATVE
ncbi:MAG: phosphoribosylglycinamide formyltransferase [Planctomycetota bacterium]